MSKNRVLVVEAEPNIAAELEDCLNRLGYEVAGQADAGDAAVREAKRSRPDVVLMDIGLEGLGPGGNAARSIQTELKLPVIYLSANSSDTTIFRACDAEPFGLILTPFDERELKVTIEMAVYRHRMEMEREDLIRQLQDALAQVKALSGLLPICAQCKKVRDDGGYWSQVEAYIEERTEARFTHGLCPDCYERAIAHHQEELRRKRQRKRSKARQAVRADHPATVQTAP